MSANNNPPADRRGDFGTSRARVATAAGAIVGLVLILVGLIMGLSPEGWASRLPIGKFEISFAPVYLEGVGVLAVAFFIFFNIGWLAKVVSGRAALSGLLVAVMCTAAVVLWLAGIYFFSFRGTVTLPKFVGGRTIKIYRSWDITRTKRYTLDERSVKALAELKEPLKFVVVGQRLPDPPERSDANDLLGLYKAARPDKVEIEYLSEADPKHAVKKKNLADQIKRDPGELGWGTLAVLYGDKQFRVLQATDFWEYRPRPMGGQVASDQVFKGEEVITSAIFQLLDAKKPKVYFVAGHGERDPDSDQDNGLGLAAGALGRDNVEVAKLQLVSVEKIPADANLVVICGPSRAFSEDEINVLQKYVAESKGRLLVCLDEFHPEADVGLEPLLAAFGIAAGRDALIEPDSGFGVPGRPDFKHTSVYGSHPIIDRLAADRYEVFFRKARTVRGLEEYPGPWKVDVLMSGSPESYGETDLEAWYNRGATKYDEAKDGPKPANYAAVSWEGKAPMPGGNMAQPLGRVVVFGDSDWCANWFLRQPQFDGNRTLFSSAVKWLLGQEKRIVIAPKKVEEDSLVMTPAQSRVANIILWSAPLLLALVAGIMAWVRRR